MNVKVQYSNKLFKSSGWWTGLPGNAVEAHQQ